MNLLEGINYRDQSYQIKKLTNGLTLLHIPLEHDARFFISAHILTPKPEFVKQYFILWEPNL